jgi:phosphoribosylformimino-5-aminoimidazole carboxamide ribotide isomerase
MIIYPAMDLMGGQVVRLTQGRFDEATIYPADPAGALAQFAAAGAQWAHLVDLDGARAGRPVQHVLIAELARTAPIQLQVAGGFRERYQLKVMFDAGVARVIIGSLAVREPETVRGWIVEFGAERVGLSLDVRVVETGPEVAVSGWTENSGKCLWLVAAQFLEARHLLLTDIGRDGMLEGPNFDLYEEASERLPHLRIQASGGVASLGDLARLGTDGAIVGKALWEGRFALEEAVGHARA